MIDSYVTLNSKNPRWYLYNQLRGQKNLDYGIFYQFRPASI